MKSHAVLSKAPACRACRATKTSIGPQSPARCSARVQSWQATFPASATRDDFPAAARHKALPGKIEFCRSSCVPFLTGGRARSISQRVTGYRSRLKRICNARPILRLCERRDIFASISTCHRRCRVFSLVHRRSSGRGMRAETRNRPIIPRNLPRPMAKWRCISASIDSTELFQPFVVSPLSHLQRGSQSTCRLKCTVRNAARTFAPAIKMPAARRIVRRAVCRADSVFNGPRRARRFRRNGGCCR